MNCRIKMILATVTLVLCAVALASSESLEEIDGGGGETQLPVSSYSFSSNPVEGGGEIERSDDDGGAVEEEEEPEEEADAEGAGTRSKIRLESLALAKDALSSGTSSAFGSRPYSGGFGSPGQGSPFGPDSPFGQGSSFGGSSSGNSYGHGNRQPDPSLALLPRGESTSPFTKGGSSQEGGGGGGSGYFVGEGAGSGESGSGNTAGSGGGFPGFGSGFPQGGTDTGSSPSSKFGQSGQYSGNFGQHRPSTNSQSGRKFPQGESVARYPQGSILGNGYHQVPPLGHFFQQGAPLNGFHHQGFAQGQLFPQGHANVNSFHNLPGFPQASPARGHPNAQQREHQQPLRGAQAQYPFAAPIAYTPLYRSVPLHTYAVSQR